MGKKTSTNTKGAPAEKRAAKPSSKAMRAAEQAVIAPPVKSAAPKSAGTRRNSKPEGSATPAYTEADISLRVYYISEKRMADGLPGDSHQDWLEAERQLMAEATATVTPQAKRKA